MHCELDYSEGEARKVNSLSRSDLAGSRGKTVSGHLELKKDKRKFQGVPQSQTAALHKAWMQWMTMTSVVPCHAHHAPQHAVASPFGPLDHSNDFLRPCRRSRLYITGTGKSRYASFCLELPTPRWIADQGLRAPSNLGVATKIRLTAI